MPYSHHSPPAVCYPIERSHRLAGAGLLLWLFEAMLLVLWTLQTGAQPPAVLFFAGMTWLMAGAALLHAWRNAPIGRLLWDGGAWWWQAHDDSEARPLAALKLQLDLQRTMLVAWHAPGERWRMAWLSQGTQPWRWGDWRRAVYSAATILRKAGQGA